MKILTERRYFLKVLTLVAISILVTINLLSFILYRNYEKNSIHRIKQTNIEALNETSRINEYIGKTIKLSGMSLLYETSIQKIMGNSDTTNFEKVEAIRRMDAVKSTNAHIHSIYLYNNSRNYIYSTSNYLSDTVEEFCDQDIIDRLGNIDDLISLHPVPRLIVENEEKIPVYTYFFFNKRIGGSDTDILIINLNMNWLMEIEGETDTESDLYILNQDNHVVYNQNINNFLQDKSKEKYIQNISDLQTENGYLIQDIEGKDYLLVYSKPENQEWKFIKIMPYESLSNTLLAMRNKSIKILVYFLVLGAGVAVLLSKILLKPIDKFIAMFKGTGIKKESDDISFLTSSIENMLEKTSDLENISKIYLNNLQIEILKEIIVGNISNEEEIKQALIEYEIDLAYDGSYYLIVSSKGDKDKLADLSKEKERGIYNFNIAENNIYILIYDNSKDIPLLIEKLQLAQCEAIAVSGLIKDMNNFYKSYKSLEELLREKIFYPRGHVLYFEDIKDTYITPRYPSELEGDILSSLRNGEVNNAINGFKDFLDSNSNYKYDYFKFYLIRFLFSLQDMIEDMNLEKELINYDQIKRDNLEVYLNEINDISEIEIYFKVIFKDVNFQINQRKSKRNSEIIDKCLSFIHKNYQDPNLNIQMVADNVGFSSSYLTQICKTEQDLSLSEYIVGYRLEKAKQYLIEKDYTIKEIAKMVGFSNSNYFYTRFRRSTGMTPGQYRKKHS